MRIRLLNCLAGAVLKHGPKFLFSLAPGGDVIYEIAAETWTAFRKNDEPDAARLEVEALAQASAEQVREAIAQAVKEAAAEQSSQVQEALRAYLNQVPSAIRRSMRRPSDPSGKSVPADVGIRGALDLVPFLPARMPRFKPGDRPLPGVDWELEELAGVGGFGEVWKARHPYLKSKPPVALKFCLDSSATAALRNEAGVLDRVMQHGRHAGIVPLLHTYLSADPPCLEYEYVEGGDLTGLIQEMHVRGRVKPAVANRLLVALAEIVAFAHKAEPPIVHGDLKPANVLVRRMPDRKVALRVIDFGIGGLSAARAVQEARTLTRSRPALLTEAVRGAHTPVYASPQQMARRPGEQPDPRDDVHALGVIWYQLITGDLGMLSIPSDWREQLGEHGVGEDLIRLLGSCIAPKADKRPANAAVLVEQVNDANVPMLELIDEGAVGPAKAEKPGAVVPKTARPEKSRGAPSPQPLSPEGRGVGVRGAPPVVKPATTRPPPQPGTVRPAETGRRRPTGETKRAVETAPTAGRARWGLGCLGAGLAAFALVAIVGVLVVRSYWFGSQAPLAKIDQEKALKDKDNGAKTWDFELPLIDGEEKAVKDKVKPAEKVEPAASVTPPVVAAAENALIREMKFVRLPKGTAWLGGGSVEGAPKKQVAIDYDVELAAYTVTQGQWQEVMGNDPSYFSRDGKGSDTVKDVGDADLKRFPVESVSWDDVTEFLGKLNEREKGKGYTYRLPKEAEWEYGCRNAAGKENSAFDFYLMKGTNDLTSTEANFNGEYPGGNGAKGKYLGRLTKVGSYPANKLGLYDMNGNVWQWCEDLYDNTGPCRVFRGGGWSRAARRCRAASRSRDAPSDRYCVLGFRVSRVPLGQ